MNTPPLPDRGHARRTAFPRRTRLAACLVTVLGSFLAAPAETVAASGELLARLQAGPLAGVEEFVFAARKMNESDGHWYANLGYYAHDANRKAWREGTHLYRWNLTTDKLVSLLDDPRGGARDPQVHYDGRKILFSYRRGGTEQYHLYEINSGDIKKLLVLETLPMPIHYTGGMDPISYGGTFTLERIVGTVPVEPDGSAYLELPALRSFFFVALDEHDLSVKRMQSFLSVQPGEVTGCVGCHEQRTRTPAASAGLTLAARRPASRIEPIADVPEVIDFPRDIQPVLDALCVDCHGYEKTAAGGPRAGRLLLAGDRGPMFSHSYYMLTVARLFSDGRNQPRSNYQPRTLGSSASRLLQLLDGSHYGVRAAPHQMKLLRLWIESGAAYPGTYAALGTGMVGAYAENQQANTDWDWPATRAAAAVLARRCAGCHADPGRLLPQSLSDERGVSFWQPSIGDPRLNTSRHIVFNLSRPERSLVLLAPLATDAGGWGLCRDLKTGQPVPVFPATTDQDYRTLLTWCQAGQEHLGQIKRFDMPDFRPRVDWVREMQRYGVLPRNLSPGDRIDVYAVERRYWESLWHRPAGVDLSAAPN